MRDVHVVFLERALVEKHFEAFAGGQLALGVLGVDALLPAAETGLRTAGLQLFENGAHQRPPLASSAFQAIGKSSAASMALTMSPRRKG